MKTNTKNLIRLSSLEPGETFSIPTVPTMRNGVFLFTTETSSRCIIDVESHIGWKNGQREYLTNSLMVQVTGKIELENSGGVWEIKGRTVEDKKELKESRKVAEKDSEKENKKSEKLTARNEREQILAELKAKKKELAAKNKVARLEKQSKKVAKAAAPGVQSGEPKTRGRKKKVLPPIIFPKTEFTLNDLAEKNGVKNYDIAGEIARLKSLGEKIEIVRYQANPRGRPTPYYKVL